MRHTQGPWTAIMSETANGAPDTARIKNADGVGVAITNHANAQLIAAAPEMLEALEWLMEYLNRNTLGTVATEYGKATLVDRLLLEVKMRDVIAKARGKS